MHTKNINYILVGVWVLFSECLDIFTIANAVITITRFLTILYRVREQFKGIQIIDTTLVYCWKIFSKKS